MRVLIVGAAGMLGGKLARRLAAAGRLREAEIESIALADVVEPAAPPGDASVDTVVCDIADPVAMRELLAARPEVIFDLAAVVSGEAELDFETGYRINLDGTRHLLEAVRLAGDGYRPRLVFSSSIAVFGPPFPDVIGDDQATTPATSYGTQKAIVELLIADYSRRGFIDGIGIRLPTICVRPGAPNRAASGFFSGIIREPLNGQEAVLPVARDVRHWFASPRAGVGFLLHAASVDTDMLGCRRSLTMPGVSASIEDEIAALRRVGGEAAVALIREERDPLIARVVDGWPRAFDARRATALGFVAERDFDEIVRIHVEDELGGLVPAAERPA
ncbi:MAG TPA: D-erythronate dehydrogenase [Solirubrobacteraceae bacterium]|nr:D-erythronate dehydrogenase [Solirubrobacteraceae bacterium]